MVVFGSCKPAPQGEIYPGDSVNGNRSMTTSRLVQPFDVFRQRAGWVQSANDVGNCLHDHRPNHLLIQIVQIKNVE